MVINSTTATANNTAGAQLYYAPAVVIQLHCAAGAPLYSMPIYNRVKHTVQTVCLQSPALYDYYQCTPLKMEKFVLEYKFTLQDVQWV